MLEAIQPFFISFVIGLLIGIERERSQIGGIKAIGMRTFILFSLLGTLAAKINQPMLTLTLSLFVFAALLLSYLRATRISKRTKDIGITTEMAAATVFILGYLLLSQKLLAICISTVVLIILYGRSSLHRFAKEKITAKEIEAAITVIIISLGIISFLPDRTIDPWQLFNPQSFGIIFLILAGLQFGGYIIIRLFGERLGMILVGFFGGMVSSTAVFASLSQAKKTQNQNTYPAVVAGIFATIATLSSFLIVIMAAAPSLLQYIIWPTIAAITLGGLSSWLLMRKKNLSSIAITYPNPLDIQSIIKLGVYLIIILLLMGITKQFFGPKALPITAFITGLFEIHAIAYAIASLFNDQSISLMQATELLAIVALASFISKFALVWIIAHNRFSLIVSTFLAGMVLTGGLVYFLILPPGLDNHYLR